MRGEALVWQARTLVKSGRFAAAVAPIEQAQQAAPREDVARSFEHVRRMARSQS